MASEQSIAAFSAEREEEVVRALERAFAANPLHVAVFGRDGIAANEAFFRVALTSMSGEKRIAIDGAPSSAAGPSLGSMILNRSRRSREIHQVKKLCR
jgi:hypothetical protein